MRLYMFVCVLSVLLYVHDNPSNASKKIIKEEDDYVLSDHYSFYITLTLLEISLLCLL